MRRNHKAAAAIITTTLAAAAYLALAGPLDPPAGPVIETSPSLADLEQDINTVQATVDAALMAPSESQVAASAPGATTRRVLWSIDSNLFANSSLDPIRDEELLAFEYGRETTFDSMGNPTSATTLMNIRIVRQHDALGAFAFNLNQFGIDDCSFTLFDANGNPTIIIELINPQVVTQTTALVPRTDGTFTTVDEIEFIADGTIESFPG